MVESGSEGYPLKRRDVAMALLAERNDMLVVAGLGSTAWDPTAAGDHPLTFPLWGAMGGAVTIRLGLALAQTSRRVLVITGDGEMLMGLGSLATVAAQAPVNLAVCVFDNERYGETGRQLTHTAMGVSLTEVAAACGIRITGDVRSEDQLAEALPVIRNAAGPVFFNIKVRAEKLDFVLPPKNGVELKERFRLALLDDGATD